MILDAAVSGTSACNSPTNPFTRSSTAMAKRAAASAKSSSRPSPTCEAATTDTSASPSRPVDPRPKDASNRQGSSSSSRSSSSAASVAPSWLVAIIAALFLASALQVFHNLNGGDHVAEAVQLVRRAAVSDSTVASTAAGPTATATSTNLVLTDPITGQPVIVNPNDPALIGSGGGTKPTSGSPSSPAPTGLSSTSGTATTGSATTITSGTDTSTPTIDPDGLVVDPRTPMGSAVFLTPYTYTNVQDMTILSLETPMQIKWAYKDVLLPPKIITIQILPPLAANQKVIGAGVKTPEQRWKNVAVNITGSATAFNWTIDQPAGQQYKLRLFDSDLGPTPANAPGRLGTSTSSMFALYQPGGPVTLVDVFAAAHTGVSVAVGWMGIVVVATIGVQLVL
ncbi:hypothetical protein AMAG_10975 [Allomyces macrogynus ATCC 38327]|uniref:DUF7137 domain-containing protein n=1 Tax=Allomyces macrogynus (strain ATCC 38327) TaxID=578462 RepID=A0A0L0SS01_ALLM3|nr:hypothetical protein AMAG_10975 [Allomyces macrogynus ATCC 38327]|eukprot:KNE65333.1 hypothetical protein AMAG_10975 [Allomyces macrogynus ATCC 38327]